MNYQENYRQKLLKFQSLLQKYAKQPLQEKIKIDPQIEVAFSDAIIALEQIPLNQTRFGRSLLLFNLIEVIKDTDLINKYSLQLEQIIIDDFRLSIDNLTMFQAIFNGIKALKLIPKYIDEILNLIKHFPSVTIQLTALKILINNMDDNLIDSNHSVLQEMIEMGFKEAEQSVFRSSWELLSLVTILNRTSMMRNYSSRLKSLISDIITAMELDDEDEWEMKSFCKLVSAVKQTSFMDYFLPQLEQLFSKLLKEFEKEPWLLESEEFDYFAIADTKLLEKLKEWERKWMKI